MTRDFEAMLRRHLRHRAPEVSRSCSGFDADTANAYLEDALGRQARRRYEEHLAGCHSCRLSLVELFRLMPPDAAAAHLSAPLRASVWDRFRASLIPTSLSPSWVLGAAIVLIGLLIAPVMLLRTRVSEAPDIASRAPAAEVAPSAIPEREAPISSPTPALVAANPGSPPRTPSARSTTLSRGPAARPGVVGEMSARTDQLTPQGALTGRVSDAAGNAVAQAQINLIEAASRQSRAANTDEQGQFKIDDLPPGNYSVTVQASGFKQQQIAELKLEGRRDLALKLEPGSTSETVVIASESAAARTTPAAATTSPSTVEKRETTIARAPSPAAPGRTEVTGVRKNRDGEYALIEPAKRTAKTPSKPVEDDETVRAMTRKVRDKVFRYERGRWIDTAFKPEALLPRVRFERGSDEFRRVVEEHPALKPFFDELSGYVIVVWQGKVYEVRK